MAIQFSFTSEAVMTEPSVEILLVQRDQAQVVRTLDVLDTHHSADRVHVVRDGDEALEFLFCSGAYASRAPVNPRLVLVDLDVAYRDDLEVLRRIKQDPRTSQIPVTILAPCASDRLAAMRVLQTYDMQVPVVVIGGMTLRTAADAFGLDGDDDQLDSSVQSAGSVIGPSGAKEDLTAPSVNFDTLCHEPEIESLARLARGIAHEFNNLFSVIVASTDLVLRDMDFDDPRRDGAEAIFKSIARASKLTRQLLTFHADATRAGAASSADRHVTKRNGKGTIRPA
jgi:two-component system, response regulator